MADAVLRARPYYMSETFDVLSVTEYVRSDNTKATRFLRVGAAFKTKDGTGMVLKLDAIPVSGRLLVKPRDENRGERPASSGSSDDIAF